MGSTAFRALLIQFCSGLDAGLPCVHEHDIAARSCFSAHGSHNRAKAKAIASTTNSLRVGRPPGSISWLQGKHDQPNTSLLTSRTPSTKGSL